MGTWGTAIYSCDIANEVRDACKDVFAFYDIERGNDVVFSIFSDTIKQDVVDNECASFWYALADWQWDHGMLTDYVKNKALELLDNYAGIDEWNDNGRHRDVAKRKKILDTLKGKITMSQPALKKPKLSVARPRHNPGDIIIFKASINDDLESDSWKIENLRWPIFFESESFLKSKHENISGYNAQGSFMALLCIGSVKEQHSQYLENIFDERSLYVWYDYLSKICPTQDMLKKCGFLPFIQWQLKDFNKKITQSVNWIYTFTLACESFRINKRILEIMNHQDKTEVERFNMLFAQKSYSSDYHGGFSLFSMFGTVFGEKNRAELINEQVDNLLCVDITNPILADPLKVDKELRKHRKEYLL